MFLISIIYGLLILSIVSNENLSLLQEVLGLIESY